MWIALGKLIWGFMGTVGGWIAKCPFQVACVLLALYAWHLRGDVRDQAAEHAIEVAALTAKLGQCETDLQNETANAAAAVEANATQTETIATLHSMLVDSIALTDRAKNDAADALAQLRKARQNVASAAASEAALREMLYANDAESARWRNSVVPGPIAERLRQSAAP